LNRQSSIHAILPAEDHGSVVQLKNKELMDQELLEYLQAFRAENAKRFDELGQRIDGTSQEVRSLREETTQLRQETAQRFDATERRFDETERRFDEVNQEFRSIRGRFDKLETDVQGVHVIVESLEGKIQLVAEGVTTVSHQLQRQGEDLSRRLDTVESFNRLLYKDLDSRVKKLEAL
jgi:chromosome segregation ATPase